MNEINTNQTSLHNAQPTKQKRSKVWLIVLILSVLLLCCALSVFLVYALSFYDEAGYKSTGGSVSYVTTYGETSSENKILTVAIKGPILNEASSQGLDIFGGGGYVYGYDIKSQLIAAADDTSIKAVMLEIDSPGGTITGSQAISDGVAYYKEATGNPVYAHNYGYGGIWGLLECCKCG